VDPADLKTLPLFASLTDGELERLSRWADDVDVPAGKHLVEEGAWAWEFFVILEGEAEVLRDGQHLADLGPGDFFGEMGVREHQQRSATVVARTRVRIGVMLERDFHEMEEEMPEVAARITAAIEERRNR
jgi:CRP/FNR family transcriptional regulator, cyclic AMP receptor protein